MPRTYRPYALLGLSMLSWGCANPLSDLALESLDVWQMTAIEIAVGFIVLSCIAVAQRRKLRLNWKWAALLGLLEPGLTYFFGNLGYETGTVAVGLIIMSSETLMLALLGWLLLKENISAIEKIAIAVGFAGAVLVGWSGVSEGVGSITGSIAFFLAAAAAAGYAIAIRSYITRQRTVDIFSLTWGQTLVSMGLASAAFVLSGSQLPSQVNEGVLAATGAGIFGVAIPFLLFAKASEHVPARHAAIALNIIPVVGISIGALMGRGLPTMLQLIGGAIVIASLMAFNQRSDSEVSK